MSGRTFQSSLCARELFEMDRSMDENCPFKGFILVGWLVFSSNKLSSVRSFSIILPLVSVL